MGSFEKKTGRTDYSKALERELKQLVDPKSGLLSHRCSAVIKCPLCKSSTKEHSLLFVKRGYSFVRCNACRLMFSNPQVLPEIVADGFRNRTFSIWARILTNKAQFELDVKKYRDVLALIESHSCADSLLDIGYTGGGIISEAVRHGWNVTGLEHIPASFRNAAKNNSGNVLFQRIDQPFPALQPADCITLFEFLEHVPNPVNYVTFLRPYLKKSGLLFLLLPNVDSLAARILHERAAMFDGRYQLIYYSIDTITKLLLKCGFKVIHIDTIYTSISPILEHLCYSDPYQAPKDSSVMVLKQLKLNKNKAEEWIIKNKLGYKMRVLARRID